MIIALLQQQHESDQAVDVSLLVQFASSTHNYLQYIQTHMHTHAHSTREGQAVAVMRMWQQTFKAASYTTDLLGSESSTV